jgi:membrane fusion protein (multidrug efflux system)
MRRITGILLSLLAALFFLSCSKSEQSQGGAGRGQTVTLEAVVAKPEQLKSSVRGLGILLPSKEVEMQSEIAGRIQSVYFRDGQDVKNGASLVKIEDANLRATMSKAHSKLILARSTAQRKKQQFDAGAISAQEWELVQAELQAAEADSIDAGANLKKTLIRAPFEGKLGIGRINIGERISVGDRIVKIVQKYPLKVDFSVADKYASVLQVGMEVEFNRNAKSYMAVIDALESSLDGSTRTLQARAIVTGEPEELVPGAPLEFLLNLPPRESLTVPPEAIGSDALGSNVYLYKGGKAKLTRVNIGTRFVDKVELLNGVNFGDTVLCVGASPIRNGGNVEISRLR